MSWSVAGPTWRCSSNSDREMAVTGFFISPLEWIWKLWTEPDYLARWWGPSGFVSTISKVEPWPGGVWKFVMHAPDGTDSLHKFVCSEAAKFKRIVCEHVSKPRFRLTVTFKPQGRYKTQFVMRLLFESPPHGASKEMFGTVEALHQTLLRLRRCAAEFKGSDFTIVRLMDAPCERVFRAWTDAEQLERWFGPKESNTRVVLYPTSGGALRIVMCPHRGDVHTIKGVPEEVVAPERLVWQMDFSEYPKQWHEAVAGYAGRVKTWRQKPCRQFVAFRDRRGRTLMTIRTRFQSAEIRDAMIKVGIFEDLKQSLERLQDLMARP